MLAEAYGEAAPGMPASNATLYNIASMSKPISAEVILRLAAVNKLSLDEPMHAYWVDPDLAADPRAKLLTTRMALDHQTGFANWRRETGGKLTEAALGIPVKAISTSRASRRRRPASHLKHWRRR